MLIIWVGAIFAAAALIHGVCGFGFSMLSVSALALVIGPRTAIPLDVIAASANCFYLLWHLRKSLIREDLILLSVLSLLGVPVGTLFLRGFDVTMIYLALGITIAAVAVTSLVFQRQLRIFASTPFKWFAGITGGVLGGAFNIPGPPLVIYAYNCGWPLRSGMANLQFLFCAMTIVTIVSFHVAGLFTKEIIVCGFAYMPLIAVFTLTGAHISARLNGKYLSMVINAFLVMLGLGLIVKAMLHG